MLGSIHPDGKSVTVVGAGISGLLSAYYLDRAGYEVRLVEASESSGGLIGTVSTPYGIAERAANSLLVSGPVHNLCRDLGVPMRGILKTGRSRYIWRNHKCRRMPLSPFELLGVLRRVFFKKGLEPSASRTLEEWGAHHLGSAGLTYLLTPFVLGIYGAAPSDLAVSAAFPFLQAGPGETVYGAMKRRKRSQVTRSRPVMQAPREGLGMLVAALEDHLKNRLGDRFELGRPLERLPEADTIWLSTPASVSADLLADVDPVSATALRRVRYAPLVSVTVFVTLGEMTRFHPGTGVLIPPSEGRGCLGVLFPSSTFAHRVTEARFASFTMMLGGAVAPEILDESDDAIRSRVVGELAELFGYSGEPLHMEIFRWPRAIPVYSPDLVEVWETMKSEWCATPGHVLMGNYTGGVSIRGMIETLSAAFPPED